MVCGMEVFKPLPWILSPLSAHPPHPLQAILYGPPEGDKGQGRAGTAFCREQNGPPVPCPTPKIHDDNRDVGGGKCIVPLPHSLKLCFTCVLKGKAA